jgi:formate dehydrogenase iron-sulfur subunit
VAERPLAALDTYACTVAAWTPDLEALLDLYTRMPGGLLPALHALQHEVGHLDPSFVPPIALAFNRSVAEVHGVISFYKDFRTTPPRGPLVQVCRAEACTARGADAVAAAAHGLAATVPVELDEVFCLGNCALGPTLTVAGVLHGNVAPAEVGVLLRGADGAGAAPVSGSPAHAAVSGNDSVAVASGAVTSGAVTSGAVAGPDAPAGPGAAGRPADVVVYVPGDAAARAVGADEVARRFAAQPGVRVVRNGSRGLLWCEPLVEVVTPEGRVAYGPVRPDDVASLVGAGALQGGTHPLCLGDIEAHSWLAGQQRLTFRRVGVVDPRSLADYEAHGGLAALRRALSMAPVAVVDEVTASGLRGRGGAAFPAGIKWKTVLDTPADQKYVVANADEGDSGTFADRMLMEGDPFVLLEGMTIAGLAVGATEGYVYVRSEYPDAIAVLRDAVTVAEAAGWLGDDVLGSGRAFRVDVRVGAGAYICGEETSLLESLEGRRGVVRAKPPLPAVEGLFGKPTLVNNVLTLASVPAIVAEGGAAAYAALGSGRSRGTQVFQLAGNIARGGIVEVPFGVTVQELVHGYGGGTATGRPVRTAQIGGPLGAYVPVEQFDLPADYEAFAEAGALLGHGGVVVFDDTVDMAAQARFAMAFCAAESCGKCTPCRIGAVRGVEIIDKIRAGQDRDTNLALLDDLCEVMADGSLCAMGGLTPMPVRSALRHFADDFLREPRGPGAPAATPATPHEGTMR